MAVDMPMLESWFHWATTYFMQGALFEQVSVPLWALGLGLAAVACLTVVVSALLTRTRTLQAQLEQSSEDSATLSELFSSELERLRVQLSQTQEDSDSLDEILGSILKGGLPGHLEMTSKDYWCVKTMEVSYTDQEGERRNWRQSGYHVNCFVPGGARDIEVTFGVVGGAECKQVDRSKPDFPYIYDETGRMKLEKFTYERCPGNVRYELRGPSLATFVSHVTEVPAKRQRGSTGGGSPINVPAMVRKLSTGSCRSER